MANESVNIELGLNGGNVVRRVVYDSATISKGSLCIMSGGNNEAAKSTANTGNPKVAFAGIAAADKISGDGSTTLGFYTQGVYDLTSATGATFANGELVYISGANFVAGTSTALDIISGVIVGKAEETASSGEVVRIRLLGV